MGFTQTDPLAPELYAYGYAFATRCFLYNLNGHLKEGGSYNR